MMIHAAPLTTIGILLGLLLGVRHALEPDHLAALSTLVTEERSARRAAWLGASWGIGHTLALLIVAVVLTIVRVNMPQQISDLLEFGVAVMLIGLGMRAIAWALRVGSKGPDFVHSHGAVTHRHPGAIEHLHFGRWTLARRPLLVGIVHGLAGSGALTALVMASLPSVSAQMAYIVVFGLGSTAGMALLSTCAGWPIARLQRRPLALPVLSGVSGLVSIVFGVTSGYTLLPRFF